MQKQDANFMLKFFKQEALANANIASELKATGDAQGHADFTAMAEFCNSCLQQLEQNANADIYTMFAAATCDLECLLTVLDEDYERPDLALLICTEVDGRKAYAIA